jgi:hypothetical protein
MRIPVVCTVLAFGLAACHGSTAYVSGGGLASVRQGLPDAAPCNDLEQQGTEVELTASPALAPRATGGTIEDGTYVLTKSTLHTRDTPAGTKLVAFGRITMVVKSGVAQLVKTDAEGHMRRTSVKRTIAGTVTVATTTCASPVANPSPESSSVEFAATSNSVQFITPGPAGTVVATYTRL